jgi:hypothetical protein
MSRRPYTFKLCDAQRLMRAAMASTGLPADRLKLRYDPREGLCVEPVSGSEVKQPPNDEVESWMRKHAHSS